MSSVFDAMFNHHALPTLSDTFGPSVSGWESGDEIVTAIQLPSGLSCSASFNEHVGEKQDDNGIITNTIKAELWVPLTVKPVQRSTWRIVRADGSESDWTGISHGKRSGGRLCVELEQVTTSKFTGAFQR